MEDRHHRPATIHRRAVPIGCVLGWGARTLADAGFADVQLERMAAAFAAEWPRRRSMRDVCRSLGHLARHLRLTDAASVDALVRERLAAAPLALRLGIVAGSTAMLQMPPPVCVPYR